MAEGRTEVLVIEIGAGSLGGSIDSLKPPNQAAELQG